MKHIGQLQTMAISYREICEGEQPWVALGNFMNDWFEYEKDRRAELVAEPLSLPSSLTPDMLRWATFCAASVEWLCDRYAVPCPSWVCDPIYHLPEPWFDAPYPNKPVVRTMLLQTTPEPFTRRNIFCGNRMFANKYELAEQHRLARLGLA